MMDFLVIAAYGMLLALACNKYAMKKYTKKMIGISKEITDELLIEEAQQ